MLETLVAGTVDRRGRFARYQHVITRPTTPYKLWPFRWEASKNSRGPAGSSDPRRRHQLLV